MFGLLPCSALVVGFLAAADAKEVPLDIMAFADNTSSEGQLIVQTSEAFKATNPGIEVNYSVTFNDPFHEKARARGAGKNAPDVIYLWPSPSSINRSTWPPPWLPRVPRAKSGKCPWA